jgi:two-component system cell cycle sensor histidine kinase/response regulator CckA
VRRPVILSANTAVTTLRETIALLEATLEATHDGILVVDLSHRVVRFNRQFLKMFGVTVEQIAGRPVADVYRLVADQLASGQSQLCSTELCRDPSAEVRDLIEFKDGRVYHGFIAPQRVKGRIVGRVASYRDVTEAKRSAQALEEQRAALEEAQEVAHVGSWIWELGAVNSVVWSAETCRILGLPSSESAGGTDGVLALVHPDDREAVRRASLAAITAGQPQGIEHRIVREDGRVRWVQVKAHVIRDTNGVALRIVGTVQDITERRVLEEQLRQSQKLEAIGRLAGGVAHDLNNALTVIVGYTELALGALAGDHPAFPDVQEVRRGAERAESVTRQLLAFSRKQRLQPRHFNLSESIGKLRRMLERLLGAGIELETAVDETLPPIYGDPGQIEQALINLAVNARDAMGEAGRLTLRLGVTRVDDAFARAHPPLPPGEYVELSVSDTGQGMDDETQAHIFEPFFTTKDLGKGTGLGLAMVYGTVKQSGGFVFVDSQIGRGTTFRLYFPPAALPDGFNDDSEPVRLPAPFTILIADDEPPIRNLVVAALSNEGYCLLHASSGAEALQIAAGRNGPIDLLMTDANMPGMGGLDLARELVRIRSDIKVIVMSGDSPEKVSVPGISQPVALLPKPFTPGDLRQKVREVLGADSSQAR